MKKLLIAILTAFTFTSVVTACPQWECQLPLDDYSCGGVHGGCGSTCTDNYSSCNYYDETTAYDQYIYCPYCGHEMWDCICGAEVAINNNYSDYQESYCDYQTDYSCGNGYSMSHWANVRDCYGNIIGQVGYGSSVEVCGTDPSNPDRVLIYDYATGTYGSVLSECVYGGYQWDGTGDNGTYNQYNGGCDANNQSYVCDTSYSGDYYGDGSGCEVGCDSGSDYAGSYGSYGGYCGDAVIRYTESYQVVRQWEMTTKACNSTCWR